MEWIDRPLLMLEVRGSNPATPSQKIPLLYPEALEAPRGAGRGQLCPKSTDPIPDPYRATFLRIGTV